MISLDIFADPVCPWCLIGKARLDRALEARPDHPFVIAWHPFQLNPDMPAEGVERGTYLEAKFGSRNAVVDLHKPIIEAADALGLTIDLAAITRIPNTLDAHRMIHWAGQEGRQTAMIAALMRAYWREGRDIGAVAVLADLGENIGMERALVTRLLASDADRDTVLARDRHARERGLNAVPSFIIANQHVVSGAQPTELWLNVIDELTGRPDV
ncbi:DsbA family oxidoreductase [Phaeovulum sp.]|uniref:DsbA family oxidoreductase n=1 Tax=Phaeovulum sp. TaxID=2934796 RepID=UPI0039E456C8